MYAGRAMKEDVKEGAKPKEPATILDVINLETSEVAQLVVPAMMKSTLEEEYEDGSYVGKCFHVKNQGKQDVKAGGGQQYNKILIEEIELEGSNKKQA